MHYIKNYDSLASNENRKVVLQLVEEAFASITPEQVFTHDFTIADDTLKIQDKSFDLSQFDRVFLIGFGKGSALM